MFPLLESKFGALAVQTLYYVDKFGIHSFEALSWGCSRQFSFTCPKTSRRTARLQFRARDNSSIFPVLAKRKYWLFFHVPRINIRTLLLSNCRKWNTCGKKKVIVINYLLHAESFKNINQTLALEPQITCGIPIIALSRSISDTPTLWYRNRTA